MKKILFILLLSTLLLEAKVVKLTATLEYENRTDHEVYKAYHRITIPSETFYQKTIDIQVIGTKRYKIKRHKNGIDRYIKLYFHLPAHSTTVKKVHFTVDIQKQRLNLKEPLSISNKESLRHYIEPEKRIESDAKQIRAIAYIIDKNGLSDINKIKLAYEFTAKYLKFSDMENKTSALSAIKSGIGDCTEYAYIFVSLLRALEIPSRKTTYFSFKKVQTFSQPNHNAAELYTDQYGWIPIYPNLSHGRYNNEFQFGNISDNVLLYKQGDTWTHYGNIADGEKAHESNIDYKISWKIKTLEP